VSKRALLQSIFAPLPYSRFPCSSLVGPIESSKVRNFWARPHPDSKTLSPYLRLLATTHEEWQFFPRRIGRKGLNCGSAARCQTISCQCHESRLDPMELSGGDPRLIASKRDNTLAAMSKQGILSLDNPWKARCKPGVWALYRAGPLERLARLPHPDRNGTPTSPAWTCSRPKPQSEQCRCANASSQRPQSRVRIGCFAMGRSGRLAVMPACLGSGPGGRSCIAPASPACGVGGIAARYKG